MKTRATFTVDTRLFEKFRKVCFLQDKKMSTVIERLIRNEVEHDTNKTTR